MVVFIGYIKIVNFFLYLEMDAPMCHVSMQRNFRVTGLPVLLFSIHLAFLTETAVGIARNHTSMTVTWSSLQRGFNVNVYLTDFYVTKRSMVIVMLWYPDLWLWKGSLQDLEVRFLSPEWGRYSGRQSRSCFECVLSCWWFRKNRDPKTKRTRETIPCGQEQLKPNN